MATSGTVATTTIDTASLLEHSMRRAGKLPSEQTPDVITLAQESLFFLLTHIANRGLNLWCVERQFIGLATGQGAYDTPAGTIDVLNVVYSTPTIVASTNSVVANGMQAVIPATAIQRVGFKPAAAYTGVVSLSADGTPLTSLPSASYVSGAWYWADLPVQTIGATFTVTGNTFTVSDVRLASRISDLPVSQWNRDTWAVQTDKYKQGHPSTNFLVEKFLTPRLTLWPVPDNDLSHLTIYRHRQVQDIGTLPQQIEVPVHWYEGIIWQLTARLVVELPNVDPNRIQLALQQAEKYEFEDELSSSDGSAITVVPGIGVYNR